MGGMASPRGPVPAGRAFLLSLQQAWGGKMPRITRPQVYRVVRELLPRNGSGRLSCCGGWKRRRIVTNGPGAPMQAPRRTSCLPHIPP